MPLFVVVLLKRTIYNKETKREAEKRDEKTREVKMDIKRSLRPILHQTPNVNFPVVMSTAQRSNLFWRILPRANYKKFTFKF